MIRNRSGRYNKAGLKIVFFSLLLFMSLIGCVKDEPSEYWSLKPGDALPEFSVTTLEFGAEEEGVVISNSSFYGREGTIIFFSTKCGDCRRELPILEENYREMLSNSSGGESPLVICISRDDNKEAVEAFWKEYDLTMPVALDEGGKIYHKFASAVVPRIYVIEGDRIIASFLKG